MQLLKKKTKERKMCDTKSAMMTNEPDEYDDFLTDACV